MEKYQVVKMHTFLHKDPCFEVCVCLCVFSFAGPPLKSSPLLAIFTQTWNRSCLMALRWKPVEKNMHKTGVIAETLRIWQS